MRQPVVTARRDTEMAMRVCAGQVSQRPVAKTWGASYPGDSMEFGTFNLLAIVLFGFLWNCSYLFLSN